MIGALRVKKKKSYHMQGMIYINTPKGALLPEWFNMNELDHVYNKIANRKLNQIGFVYYNIEQLGVECT